MIRISEVVEPIIFRIPISFLRYWLSNTTSPNTPTIEMNTAIKLNKVISELRFSSFSYKVFNT